MFKAKEEEEKRGKLKIFLGYAAGVGKTYAMLESARSTNEGNGCCGGIVETHGRRKQRRCLQDWRLFPARKLEYHGVSLTEMDLDAILTRRLNRPSG